jgi:hypothetical protein
MNAPSSQGPRQRRSTSRYQARLDPEPSAKREALASACYRTRSAILCFVMAALVLASLLSACATGWPPPPAVPECVFIPRCRNPALSTGD